MDATLGDVLESLAVHEQKTFNDVVVELIEEALEMRASKLDPIAREILALAAAKASPKISAIGRIQPDTGGNANLVLLETLLKSAIAEATEDMLVPPENTEATIALWSIAKEITDELGLDGPEWDYVRSLGKRTPPPTMAQVRMLSDAIGKLKRSELDSDTADKVEALNVYLGLARDEHEESWAELKREARAARDAAFSAIHEQARAKK